MRYNPFNMLLQSVYQYFVKDFAYKWDIVLQFSFPVISLADFVMMTLQELGNIPLLFYFWESLRKSDFNSLNIWWKHLSWAFLLLEGFDCWFNLFSCYEFIQIFYFLCDQIPCQSLTGQNQQTQFCGSKVCSAVPSTRCSQGNIGCCLQD